MYTYNYFLPGEVVRTIPTVGFNVETLEHENANFTVWDVGGQDKLRRLWKHYFPHTHGIIFVVPNSAKSISVNYNISSMFSGRLQ